MMASFLLIASEIDYKSYADLPALKRLIGLARQYCNEAAIFQNIRYPTLWACPVRGSPDRAAALAIRPVACYHVHMNDNRLHRLWRAFADWWFFQMGTIEGWFDRPETPEARAIREEGEWLRKAFPGIDLDQPGARTIPASPKDQ